jgi:streptogramin lyase
MTASPDGTVYLVDFRGGWESHLVRISSDGKVFTLTKDLSEFRLSIFGINDQHAVMGLAVDGNGNVYAAVAGNRVVKKVTPAGHVSVVARGESGWTPTGVLPRPDGVLWVLEGSSLNAVRVRRIRPDGSSTTF